MIMLVISGSCAKRWAPILLPISALVADFGRRHVQALKESFAQKPRTADYLVQIFQLLMTRAADAELRDDNPAFRPRMLRTGEGHRLPGRKSRSRRIVCAMHLKREHVAFELTLNSGQRGEDVIEFGRVNYRSGWPSVKQLKGGNRVEVPASQDLIAALDPYLARHSAVTLLADRRCVPFKVDNFRNFMRAAYDAADLSPGYTTHGLRYTQATVLKKLSCDDATIADIAGHETLAMVKKYTTKRRRARLAIARLNRARERGRNAKSETAADHNGNHAATGLRNAT